jgi:hypothetical protein
MSRGAIDLPDRAHGAPTALAAVQRAFGVGSDIPPKWSPDGKGIAAASDSDFDRDFAEEGHDVR